MTKKSIFLNGIFKENPTFVMLLGMCPTIAITTNVADAFGMGCAVIFVLMFSNLFISLIRNIVPNEIRIPVFIVIIATLVSVVQLILQAYFLALNNALGSFVALIVVNCLILGRAEAFASKNPPLLSLLDALGMGIGFTLAIMFIALIRQLLGLIIPIFITKVGGFLTLGLIIGIIQSLKISITKKRQLKMEEYHD